MVRVCAPAFLGIASFKVASGAEPHSSGGATAGGCRGFPRAQPVTDTTILGSLQFIAALSNSYGNFNIHSSCRPRQASLRSQTSHCRILDQPQVWQPQTTRLPHCNTLPSHLPTPHLSYGNPPYDWVSARLISAPRGVPSTRPSSYLA